MSTSILARPSRADVRERILAAADKVFTSNGYAGARLSQIAAEAGFTKGAVYSNFHSKPDLFAAVCEARLAASSDDAVNAITPILEKSLDKAELAASLAKRLAAQLARNSSWQVTLAEFRALARQDDMIADAYARLSRSRIERLEELLLNQPHLAHLSPGRLKGIALTILALQNVLSLESLASPGIYSQEVISGLFSQLIEGLLA